MTKPRHVLPLLFLAAIAFAQTPTVTRPVVEKVDPPNWWPRMPAPMLLLKGENLGHARISLSDSSLKIDHSEFSANGHYAQLWLASSPSRAETIQIKLHTSTGETSVPFTFTTRNPDAPQGFSSKDVMYLIMPDRFADGDPTNDGPDHQAALQNPHAWHGGDIRGITQHLDYLQNLGITTVWITPVESQAGEPTSYHGYGATDRYAVDPHFGNLDDLKALSAALHARHMKLVLDSVPNHVGPAHPWVQDSPTPTWFHGTLAHHSLAQGEFGPVTNPHAPWRDQRNVTQGWFANILPDMNQEDPAAAQYLIQNTIWWIEQAHADGLRIDTFPYVGRPFWHDFHATLHTLFPSLTTVGEVYNGDPAVTSTFAAGVTRTGVDTGLDTPFDFPTYFALRDVFLKDAPMTKLADVLRLDNLFPHPERLVPFLGNHDTSRLANDPAATPARIALAFTVLTTMRGMPQIYSGDEIAMKGGDDPDNRRDFPASAFTPATRTPHQQQTFATLQNLLTLRRTHPALQTGEEQVLTADAETFAYVRTLAGEHILIAINKSSSPNDIVIPTDDTVLAGLSHATPLLGDASTVTFTPTTLTLHLGPQAAILLQVR